MSCCFNFIALSRESFRKKTKKTNKRGVVIASLFGEMTCKSGKITKFLDLVGEMFVFETLNVYTIK